MLTGLHVTLNSRLAGADRAFFRDVLGLANVDVGGGWLVFALPPGEVAVHPARENSFELCLTCDDVRALVEELSSKGYACSEIEEQDHGALTRVTLPSGNVLGVYEPRHAAPRAAPKKQVTARRSASAPRDARAR